MADDLSFTISAQDQASKAVESVQKKIQSFGSDVAKLALGVVGPMALLQAGIGLITEKWNEYKQAQKDSEQAQKDAFDKGASGVYEQIKAQEGLGKELDKNLAIMLAIAKVKKEDAKNTEELILQENALIEQYLKSAEAQGVTTGGNTYQESSDYQNQFVREIANASRDEKLAAAKEWANKQALKYLAKTYGPDITAEQRARLEEESNISTEDKKRRSNGSFSNELLGLFVKRFIEQSALPDQAKTKESVKEDLKLTVSSLREIGGSFGGGDVSTGIEKQITLAEKQLDTLTEIKDALNRGTSDPMVIDKPLGELMTGETGKFIG
jgi:hypothetical protein